MVSPNVTLGVLDSATSSTSVNVQADGVLSPAGSGDTAALSTGNLTAAAGGVFQWNLTDLFNYDSLNVTGSVDITNANLLLYASGGSINLGDTFTILQNDGSDAIAGQFVGGTTIYAADDPRYAFTVNYTGGDGNDIVITMSAYNVGTILDVVPGFVNYASASGANNNLSLTKSAGIFTLTDTGTSITLTFCAIASGLDAQRWEHNCHGTFERHR